MKAIYFNPSFEAPDELKDYCQSLGYFGDNYYKNYDMMFDKRVVDFCEQRLSEHFDKMIYKGKESAKYTIGFAGAGYVLNIDTDRQWRITGNFYPIVEYVDVITNKYGHVQVLVYEVNSGVDHILTQEVFYGADGKKEQRVS